MKNFLAVVDENGQLLGNPVQGGWDPNQEIYIQSKPNKHYSCFIRERPLLNYEYESFYSTVPFFKAFAAPAIDVCNENGAGPSKATKINDCAHPIYTIQTTDGTKMQLRLVVLVMRKDWASRKNNRGQGGHEVVWPQALDGLQGTLVYLKIRPLNTSCYYYGKKYMDSSMWPPPPPPREDIAEEETPAKRQRTATALFVASAESIQSQKEASIKNNLP